MNIFHRNRYEIFCGLVHPDNSCEFAAMLESPALVLRTALTRDGYGEGMELCGHWATMKSPLAVWVSDGA
jgi:hypothetical protein